MIAKGVDESGKHSELCGARRPKPTQNLDCLPVAFNQLVDIGQVDKESAATVVGYLSAASVALRVLGNEKAALRFEQSAFRIKADWRLFEVEVRALAAWMDSAA